LSPYGKNDESIRELLSDTLATIKVGDDYKEYTKVVVFISEHLESWANNTFGLKYWHKKPLQIVLLDRIV
jgi:hypothetical protein